MSTLHHPMMFRLFTLCALFFFSASQAAAFGGPLPAIATGQDPYGYCPLVALRFPAWVPFGCSGSQSRSGGSSSGGGSGGSGFGGSSGGGSNGSPSGGSSSSGGSGGGSFGSSGTSGSSSVGRGALGSLGSLGGSLEFPSFGGGSTAYSLLSREDYENYIAFLLANNRDGNGYNNRSLSQGNFSSLLDSQLRNRRNGDGISTGQYTYVFDNLNTNVIDFSAYIDDALQRGSQGNTGNQNGAVTSGVLGTDQLGMHNQNAFNQNSTNQNAQYLNAQAERDAQRAAELRRLQGEGADMFPKTGAEHGEWFVPETLTKKTSSLLIAKFLSL